MNRIAVVSLISLALSACADFDPNAGVDGNTVTDHEAMILPPKKPLSTTYAVDFDHDTSGAAIAKGTTVDSVYSAWGVTFSAIYCGNTATCNTASAYTNSWDPGNDVVSLFQWGYAGFDSRWGAIEAHFANPQAKVTIDAYNEEISIGLGTPTARAWLEAYDASNNLLARTFGTVSLETWQTLTVTSTTGIAKVRFSNEAGTPYVYSAFDNLTYTAPVLIRTQL